MTAASNDDMELPQMSPEQMEAYQTAMQRSAAMMPDDSEYDDFLRKVEDVEATIKGLKDGTVDVAKLDEPVLSLLAGISKEKGLDHF